MLKRLFLPVLVLVLGCSTEKKSSFYKMTYYDSTRTVLKDSAGGYQEHTHVKKRNRDIERIFVIAEFIIIMGFIFKKD